MKPYIIIGGCARGGTYSMHKVLQSLGLDVGHESAGKDGIVAWQCLCVDSLKYQQAVELAGDRPIKYFHQYRHPLKNMESIVAFLRRGRQGIWGWRPTPLDNDPAVWALFDYQDTDSHLLKAMKFYWNFHSVPETQGWFTYRIEDLPIVWERICRIIEIPRQPIPDVTDYSNTQRFPDNMKYYPTLSWEDCWHEDPILADMIYSLIRKIGYNFPLRPGERPDETQRGNTA